MSKAKINGIEIYYETKGKGYPLLMIQGFGSSSEGWDSLAPEYRISQNTIKRSHSIIGAQVEVPHQRKNTLSGIWLMTQQHCWII